MEGNIRNAIQSDVPKAAKVFCEAFPESVARYSPDRAPIEAIADLFEMCRKAQPEHFLVYEKDGVVLGYIIAPLSIRGIMLRSVFNGSALMMLIRFLAGRYGISAPGAIRASINTVRNLFSSGRRLEQCDSRILSIGVSPEAQGKGIGKALLLRGIASLEGAGADRIRLEVKMGNTAAINLYYALGFEKIGEIRDDTGTWIAMVRRNAS